MDRNLRHRTPDRRPTRSADAPRQHPRDERRQLPARPKPRPKGRSSNLITRHRIGPMGQCAMARASYLGSTRAMALGTPPLAWFCAATWPVFAPPLTVLSLNQHVRLADGVGEVVQLLPIHGEAGIWVVFGQVLVGDREHPTGPRRRVVDRTDD